MKRMVVYEMVDLKMYLNSQGTSFCSCTMLNKNVYETLNELQESWTKAKFNNFDSNSNLEQNESES